jgi:hypothetical protein
MRQPRRVCKPTSLENYILRKSLCYSLEVKMKHFSRNSFKYFGPAKRFFVCLVLLTPLLVGLLNLSPPAIPQASAATYNQAKATQACKEEVAKATRHAPSDYKDNNHPHIVNCLKGYKYAFDNPNSDVQHDSAVACGLDVEAKCLIGLTRGVADRKSANTPQTPSSTSNIKKDAEKACQPYKTEKDQTSKDQVENFNACVAGYTGQRNGKGSEETCKSYNGSTKAVCLGGFNAATNNTISDPVKDRADNTVDPSKTGNDTAGNDQKQLDCDTQFNNPLTWIICPVVDTLAGIIDGLDRLITKQLTIKTSDIFCDSGGTCNAYYSAWQSFRNIALGIMAIFGLVIIISQALGWEILDAYTLRKALPRFLIAAVGVTLSWPVMQFLVELTNALGLGVRQLIYLPFKDLGNTLDLSFGGSITNFIFGGLITGSVAGAAVGGAAAGAVGFQLLGGIGALLAYMGTAALAVFIAIVILILRQVAIILLMLLAPLAIVAFIFPNTQKVYKLWWDSFSKALLMFPLIAAFIATGRVFSSVAIESGGALNQMIAFLAYFAPYFMIPFTLKFAGAAVGGLGNFVNSRASGGFAALGKFRQSRRQKGRERILSGNLYKGAPPGSRRERLNANWQSAAVGLAHSDEMGNNPLNWRSRARAIRERVNLAQGLKGADEHAAYAPLKGDDDAGHAILKGDGTVAGARRYLESTGKFTEDEVNRKVQHIELAANAMGQPALQQAALLNTVMASTAYTGEHGIGELVSDIDMVAGDNDQMRAQLVGQVKQRAQQAQRTDLVASFASMYDASKEIGRAPDKQAAIKNVDERLVDEIDRIEGAGFIFGGKGTATQNLLAGVNRRIERSTGAVRAAEEDMDAITRGETVIHKDDKGREYEVTEEMAVERHDQATREMKRTLASVGAMHAISGQVSDEKAGMLAQLLGSRMPNAEGNATVLDTIVHYAQDPEYAQFYNDYTHRRELTPEERAEAARRGMDGPPQGPTDVHI